MNLTEQQIRAILACSGFGVSGVHLDVRVTPPELAFRFLSRAWFRQVAGRS